MTIKDQSQSPTSLPHRYWAVALGIICGIAYLPAWQSFFVKDDIILATSAQLNPLVALQHSWPGGFFRPAAELLFAAQHLLFNLHPLPYHLLSFAAHLGCIYFAYRLFNLLPQYRPFALLAVSLFALHPLNTETVSWISGQMGLFASLCVLTTLYFAGASKRLIVLIPIFIIGLGFYESFPVVVLLWGLCSLFDDRFRTRLKPLALISLAACLGVYLYWRFEVLGLSSGNYQTALSPKTAFFNAAYYLYLLAGGSAIGARILHYRPELITAHFLDVFTPLFIIHLLLIPAYFLFRLKRRDWPDFDALLPFAWLALTLLPTLLLSERPRRLSYLAVPGFSLLIGQIFFYVQEKARPGALIAKTGLAFYILVLAATLHLRNYDWQRAGDLERELPNLVDNHCQTLAFDLPNLVGDALFFNSLSTAHWLSISESGPFGSIQTPITPTWDHETIEPGCYYLYRDGTIHRVFNISPEPIFIRGNNWVHTR